MNAKMDRAANLQTFTGYISEASQKGAKLIVFPEIALQQNPCWGSSSYQPTQEELRYLHETAETIPGPSTEALVEIARQYDIAVVFGMTEKGLDGQFYNTSVFLGPNGIFGKYRKRKLADASVAMNEHLYWRAGIERGTAEAIWDEVLRFAAYSYCKAHATVYANIAWETAWLKAHYPAEFYCSLLNNHQGMYPLRVYIWDAKRHGVAVVPPHVNSSEVEWSLRDGHVRAGLHIIQGLCGHTATTIVEQRRIAAFRDLDDLRRRVRFRRPELQNLIHVGACDSLGPTRPAMLSRLHRTQPLSEQPTLFDLYGDRLTETLPDYDAIANLKAQLDVTGIPFDLHPAVLLPQCYVPARRLREFLGRHITAAGFVATARRARTTDNRVMGFVTLEDATGLIEVSFFPEKLPPYKTICSYGGPVWVKGRVTEHLSSLSLDCSDGGRLT
jgi:error-prone DNA polymerase